MSYKIRAFVLFDNLFLTLDPDPSFMEKKEYWRLNH